MTGKLFKCIEMHFLSTNQICRVLCIRETRCVLNLALRRIRWGEASYERSHVNLRWIKWIWRLIINLVSCALCLPVRSPLLTIIWCHRCEGNRQYPVKNSHRRENTSLPNSDSPLWTFPVQLYVRYRPHWLLTGCNAMNGHFISDTTCARRQVSTGRTKVRSQW